MNVLKAGNVLYYNNFMQYYGGVRKFLRYHL